MFIHQRTKFIPVSCHVLILQPLSNLCTTGPAPECVHHTGQAWIVGMQIYAQLAALLDHFKNLPENTLSDLLYFYGFFLMAIGSKILFILRGSGEKARAHGHRLPIRHRAL